MKQRYHATVWRGDEVVLFEHPIRLEERVENGREISCGEFFVAEAPGFGLENLQIKMSDGRSGEISIKKIESSSLGSHFVFFELIGDWSQTFS